MVVELKLGAGLWVFRFPWLSLHSQEFLVPNGAGLTHWRAWKTMGTRKEVVSEYCQFHQHPEEFTSIHWSWWRKARATVVHDEILLYDVVSLKKLWEACTVAMALRKEQQGSPEKSPLLATIRLIRYNYKFLFLCINTFLLTIPNNIHIHFTSNSPTFSSRLKTGMALEFVKGERHASLWKWLHKRKREGKHIFQAREIFGWM